MRYTSWEQSSNFIQNLNIIKISFRRAFSEYSNDKALLKFYFFIFMVSNWSNAPTKCIYFINLEIEELLFSKLIK